ncbi:MAG: hypothetical protein BWY52_00945 [Chloroflexi bacterium ADurb.Bin325]|nr:MAG: hypothetical protein BWY52_00945 [Chloroflexi bacterium ADurb.Bin325]
MASSRNTPASADCPAIQAVGASRMIGRRSVKKPRLTTTAFLRGNCSLMLAVNNWGMYQPAWVMTASTPNASGSVVSLLRKIGRMVAAEMNAEPNQKNAPSSKLTVKFHV